MAAQRMPLGHKGRGEAHFANHPALRSLRGRIVHARRNGGLKPHQANHQAQPSFGPVPPNFQPSTFKGRGFHN